MLLIYCRREECVKNKSFKSYQVRQLLQSCSRSAARAEVDILEVNTPRRVATRPKKLDCALAQLGLGGNADATTQIGNASSNDNVTSHH